MAVTTKTIEDLVIKISTDSSSAVGDLKKMQGSLGRVEKSTRSLKQSLSGIGAASVKMAGALQVGRAAFQAISSTLGSFLGAFAQQEKAVVSLENALILSGHSGSAALDDFQKFASSLQDLTAVGDETTLQLLSMATAAGLTVEQSKELVKVSADVAAGMGKDLKPIFDEILGQYAGVQGRIAKYIPALKELSIEQLKVGEGVKLMGREFDGFAMKMAGTYSGQVKALSGYWGDFLEKVGEVIIKGTSLNAGLLDTAEAIKNLTTWLDKNKVSVINFIDSTLKVSSVIINITKIVAKALTAVYLGYMGTISLLWSVGAKFLNFFGAVSDRTAKSAKESFETIGQAGINTMRSAMRDSKKLFGLGDKAMKKAKKVIPKPISAKSKPRAEADKNLTSILQKNATLSLEMAAHNQTAREQIEAQTKHQVSLLNAKIASGKLSRNEIAATRETIKLLKAKAEIEQGKQVGQEFGESQLVGDSIASSITGAFTSGSTGMIMGAASAAAGIAELMLGFINMIPDAINKFADVFNAIADLPQKLLESVVNLGSAIIRVFTEGIPKLFENLPKIFGEVITLLFDAIPAAFASLMEKLPELMSGLIEKIPRLVQKFIKGFITNLPKIAVALIKYMAKDAPKIAIQILKLLVAEIPKAVVYGIIEGIMSLASIFKGAFKENKIEVDQKQVEETLLEAKRVLSGSVGDLFTVEDISQDPQMAKDRRLPQEIAAESNKASNSFIRAFNKAILGIFKSLGNFFQQRIAAMADGWMMIRKNILDPFLAGIAPAFKWVLNGINKSVSFLSRIFSSIFEKFIKPIGSFITKGFENGVEKLGEAFSGLRGIIQGAFKGILDEFSNLMSFITNIFKSIFEADFKGLGIIVTDALKGGLQGILKPFQDLINFFVDIMNKMALPDGKVKILGKTYTLWSGLDFFPDDIKHVSFLNKGGLVSGESGVDKVPAMLTAGEFVIRKEAVNQIGAGTLSRLNQGQQSSGQSNVFNFDLKINTTEPITESFLKTRLMPKIKDEFRRSSLDGSFVVSRQGLR